MRGVAGSVGLDSLTWIGFIGLIGWDGKQQQLLRLDNIT